MCESVGYVYEFKKIEGSDVRIVGEECYDTQNPDYWFNPNYNGNYTGYVQALNADEYYQSYGGYFSGLSYNDYYNVYNASATYSPNSAYANYYSGYNGTR